jgi:phage baseplate assembly protein W
VIKGFSFPFKPGETAFPEEATDNDVIKSSIIQILTTGFNSRLMRPDFGSRVFDFIFENDDEVLQILIEREVRFSLSKWEPRIRVENVLAVAEDDVAPGLITVTILYTVLATNEFNKITISGG